MSQHTTYKLDAAPGSDAIKGGFKAFSLFKWPVVEVKSKEVADEVPYI
jgi:hypothetical protein